MAYELVKTLHTKHIDINEWAVGTYIKFSPLTASVAILAKLQDEMSVLGIHLAKTNSENQLFGEAGLTATSLILNQQKIDPQSVMLVGQIADWEKTNKEGLEALIAKIQPVKTINLEEGSHEAKVDSEGKIELKIDD